VRSAPDAEEKLFGVLPASLADKAFAVQGEDAAAAGATLLATVADDGDELGRGKTKLSMLVACSFAGFEMGIGIRDAVRVGLFVSRPQRRSSAGICARRPGGRTSTGSSR